MFFHFWQHRLRQRSCLPRRSPRARNRCAVYRLLELERLEERLTPILHTWTGMNGSSWIDGHNWIRWLAE
jgi:hypothetical protein